MSITLNADFFNTVIDMTKGRRVDTRAIIVQIKSNKDKDFKIACIKLLVEGVKLSDSRKIGTKTLQELLVSNGVKIGTTTKTASEDVLTISRIVRVLAPLLVKLKTPSKMMADGKWPMSDFHADSSKHWVPVSAMWIGEMWRTDDWRLTYLYCMACLDYAILSTKAVSGDGISVVNRALRLFGASVVVDMKAAKSRDDYAKEVLRRVADAGIDFTKANVTFVNPEVAYEAATVIP